MEKINFQSKVFVLLMVLVGLLIFNTNVFTQRRKRTLVTKKPASTAKPASSKIPAPKTTRGAGEDDANTDSGLEITVGNSDPTNTGQKLTFDAPFLEKCPKQSLVSVLAVEVTRQLLKKLMKFTKQSAEFFMESDF